jgi:hypothetical protein
MVEDLFHGQSFAGVFAKHAKDQIKGMLVERYFQIGKVLDWVIHQFVVRTVAGSMERKLPS